MRRCKWFLSCWSGSAAAPPPPPSAEAGAEAAAAPAAAEAAAPAAAPLAETAIDGEAALQSTKQTEGAGEPHGGEGGPHWDATPDGDELAGEAAEAQLRALLEKVLDVKEAAAAVAFFLEQGLTSTDQVCPLANLLRQLAADGCLPLPSRLGLLLTTAN